MAKPTKDSERRAVVEQLRREQQRAERRTAVTVVVATATVAAVIVGAAAWQLVEAQQRSGRALRDIGVAASDAGCGTIRAEPAEGNNDHRTEGERILYREGPPASGPHWPQYLVGNQIRPLWQPDDRPPVERLVHSLEHGHTLLWYDATVAGDDAAMADLEALAKKAADLLGGKFAAAPWSQQDGRPFPDGTHYALAHWSVGGTHGNPARQLGVRQFCRALSGAAVQRFVEDYPATDAPEPGAA